MYERISVLAYLELFIGDNMRITPITNGYRPVFKFEAANTGISGKIDLIDMGSLLPGTSAIVRVTFLKGIISDDYFKQGVPFRISEGGKHDLGKGQIVEVI